jgi:hypothetical protein
MNDHEIQMCVADVLQDDAMENIDSILRMLNHDVASSWRNARGTPFMPQEVRAALVQLIAAGLVTPCAEQPRTYQCSAIPAELLGAAVPWESAWFHLEPTGHTAVKRWWDAEGQLKYPLKA